MSHHLFNIELSSLKGPHLFTVSYQALYLSYDNRFNTQVDVLKQLGDKLETQLELQEQQLQALPRTEAAKRRATHMKLVRDFRRVEATFKNIVLETRRNRARFGEQANLSRTEDVVKTADNDDRMQFELQLQQEVNHNPF
jgi:hypothetical protein